jgi:hypothetical protein
MYSAIRRRVHSRTAATTTTLTLRDALLAGILAIASLPLYAQEVKTLHGEVRDPLSSLVVNASVDLLQGARVIASTTTGPDGAFGFDIPDSVSPRPRSRRPPARPFTSPNRPKLS